MTDIVLNKSVTIENATVELEEDILKCSIIVTNGSPTVAEITDLFNRNYRGVVFLHEHNKSEPTRTYYGYPDIDSIKQDGNTIIVKAYRSFKIQNAYNDSKDLIQNQRDLAEAVAILENHYTNLINQHYANELEAKMAQMRTDLDNAINRCTNDANSHISETTEKLNTINKRYEDFVDLMSKYTGTIIRDADDRVLTTVQAFEGTIAKAASEVMGYVDQNTNSAVPGLVEKFNALAKKVPSIVMYPEDHVVTTDEIYARHPEVLYGIITDEVRNIEKGMNLRISPYMQGVVREIGREVAT